MAVRPIYMMFLIFNGEDEVMLSIKAGNSEIVVASDDFGPFSISLSTFKTEENLEFVKLRMVSETEARPPIIQIEWKQPAIDIFSRWVPCIDFNRTINPNWWYDYKTKATSNAPVTCLYNLSGRNRLTVALSDAMNPIKTKVLLLEEEATVNFYVFLFSEPTHPIKEYEIIFRLDTRDIPYYESIEQVQKWWAAMPGYEPAAVPEIARLPMYSTWYSFHLNLNPDAVIEQCRLSKQLGCEAVIVDDGWQTSNNERGYSYCGDWEVTPEKIPDMKDFVSKVHETGMKFLLWYGVPLVGKYSKAWAKFKGKFLDSEENDYCVLDPRFPEVREYLINIYESAVKNWGLDGLKLDFVDSFNLTEHSADKLGHGRDYDSVPEAVDRLLKDALQKLKRLKPDFMIEFRQSYIGPLMRTYGNMFRATDCPNEALMNRVRTLDVRLLCGDTAAHSDMLMWNHSEPVESAAMQIVNILFSVPQISVLLDKIPEDHLKMVRFWLDFWIKNRDVLLGGKLVPMHPEILYSAVFASTASKVIAVVYSNPIVTLEKDVPGEIILVNGTFEKRIIVEMAEDYGRARLEVKNCCGETVSSGYINLNNGLNVVEIPPAGAAFLVKE